MRKSKLGIVSLIIVLLGGLSSIEGKEFGNSTFGSYMRELSKPLI